MAGALFSGTGEALLYERLQSENAEGQFDRIYGRASAAESVGVGAGLLFGGFVAVISMDLTIWLSIPPLILGAATAFLLIDIRRKPSEATHGYLENIRLALAEFRTLPELRFVTLYIAVGLVIFGELEEFDQLYYLAVTLPIWLFGVAGAVGLTLHALASLHAHRLSKYTSLAWPLPALGGFLFIIASLDDSPYFVIVLEGAYLLSIPPLILSEARFQHLIESRARATTTSMLEFVQNITALLLALGFGMLANGVGILPAYGWAGLLLLPISAWVWWRQRCGVRAF